LAIHGRWRKQLAPHLENLTLSCAKMLIFLPLPQGERFKLSQRLAQSEAAFAALPQMQTLLVALRIIAG
jgi:hypothetical protein